MTSKPKVADVTTNGHSVAPIAAPELPPGVSIEQARQLVEQDKQERANACLAEINAVLEKYGCTLNTQMLVQAK